MVSHAQDMSNTEFMYDINNILQFYSNNDNNLDNLDVDITTLAVQYR